ncbi:restriction endonuclease [Halomarina rubra]|uniref:Restriction endonuclease n=1 Tax=Halomarina rubra TaxID=2071873 RepID=A0ABD6ATE1_9EURY|nr:restriction endonuclease [Halomarina rubra]
MAEGSDVRTDGGRRGWLAADLRALDRATLEDVVFDLYDAEGYDVEWAAPNAEGDVAIVARKSRLLRSTRTTVVTVTTAGASVTPGSVDRLDYARGMNGADRAALVHPDDVPEDAHDAAGETKVRLVDGQELQSRLRDTDLSPP